MPANDLGDGLAPCRRHDRPGRGLQRRHAIEHARLGLGKRAIEVFRNQPGRIGGNAMEAIATLRRKREHAGIAVALGQNGVVGRRDHAERDRQGMLTAVGDEEVVGIRGHAERRQP